MSTPCVFNPEPLKSQLIGPFRNDRERDESLLLFRDVLIRVLNGARTVNITGTITVTGLSVGTSVSVYVDHSTTKIFCTNCYPTFTAVNGVTVLCYPMLDLSGVAKLTNGSGFAIVVTNVSLAAYSPSFSLNWQRRNLP